MLKVTICFTRLKTLATPSGSLSPESAQLTFHSICPGLHYRNREHTPEYRFLLAVAQPEHVKMGSCPLGWEKGGKEKSHQNQGVASYSTVWRRRLCICCVNTCRGWNLQWGGQLQKSAPVSTRVATEFWNLNAHIHFKVLSTKHQNSKYNRTCAKIRRPDFPFKTQMVTATRSSGLTNYRL